MEQCPNFDHFSRSLAMAGITIGPITTRNNVFLAPMSGISDLPFRQIAHDYGAGLVVSEMIASRELARTRRDMVQKAEAVKGAPFVIQLAGNEAEWMGEGARVACDLGADIIDINMGCPARKVTGSASGSALMRDLDHAVRLVDATVAAAGPVPVTLKMRLGWDDGSHNAPELAARAVSAGVQMITVHGRTRCQFYEGTADWQAIAKVKAAIGDVPLIANGDFVDVASVRAGLAQSGADGVMIGRGCYGRPWFAGTVAEQLVPGTGVREPDLAMQCQLTLCHYRAMISFYGEVVGVRNARKHIGWWLDRLVSNRWLRNDELEGWRRKLLRERDATIVQHALTDLHDGVLSSQSCAA